ncbi:MAG: ABC transporter substrate-binding protein [Alphaproteobacteria bacterium]|nr:ABC transporter substrate-binding protein [Alphaproteobacteria bacterium]
MKYGWTLIFLSSFLSILIFGKQAFSQEEILPQPQHAVALHGSPKYNADFEHLEYVNPEAPKGGILKQHVIGSFDSLNPFIIKGSTAAGLNYMRSGLIYESLMQNSWDEPFSLYGIIAESIEIPKDRSWVAFNLRNEAKWADGKPITADAVVWTFKTLTSKGKPFFKAYWHDVVEVIAESDKRVKFTFRSQGNAELPLIIAEMVVLPKHYWTQNEHKFDETSLEAPLGSGPYEISLVDAGRSIEYTRRNDWWGKDLPFFKGFYNFDKLQYDYYRDTNVALEALFASEYDVKMENTAKLWVSAYNAKPVRDGRIIKAEIDNQRPAGMQGFIYNTRRALFQDKRVREALAYAFDFEWSNKQFAYGTYTRTNSYFENSELASNDLPSIEELILLEPFKGKIPDEVFTKTYKAPVTDGSGNARQNLHKAKKLLDEANFILGEDGVRVKNGVRLEFEILDANPQFERWVLPFIKNLERIGVKANFRVVDTAQYQNRINDFDFDMTIGGFGQSNSPGNEQQDFWGSDKADIHGSRNYIGIKDPVIDDFINKIIHAKNRNDLITKTRAMDRILLWNHYVIPMWHYPKWRIAYWNHIKHPETMSGISPLILYTWWKKEGQ